MESCFSVYYVAILVFNGGIGVPRPETLGFLNRLSNVSVSCIAIIDYDVDYVIIKKLTLILKYSGSFGSDICLLLTKLIVRLISRQIVSG